MVGHTLSHSDFLRKELWTFSNGGILTDIEFLCQDGKVGAHRALIASVCPEIFKRFPCLFCGDNSVVTLPDYFVDTIKVG